MTRAMMSEPRYKVQKTWTKSEPPKIVAHGIPMSAELIEKLKIACAIVEYKKKNAHLVKHKPTSYTLTAKGWQRRLPQSGYVKKNQQ